MTATLKSVWTDTVQIPKFPKLTQNADTDVLIIGGGMAGVLCAYTLQQRGIPYMLCEAARIGSGTTSGTTAVLSAQHDILYSDMVRTRGEQYAKDYLEANLNALEKYRRLSKQYQFDFETKPSCIYSQTDRALMEGEVRTLNRLGFDARFQTEVPLPVDAAGAVYFPNQAQMHPLKFLREICKGLNLFEHTLIDRVDGSNAYSGTLQINAKTIIIASHYPILNTHGLYFAKLYQKRSYVIALENAPDIGGTFADNAEHGMYFRSYQDLLLIGGGDHRTGKSGGSFEALRRFARQHYPASKEKYAWATQDCMSLDGIPYIGQYSPALPHVYVASGFNEWGMTTSMLAADILCDMIMQKSNQYASIFQPRRSILKAQLFRNLGTTVIDFCTPTAKRCPHMGCALKWNPVAHSWDCPCHGSRFAQDGSLLNNPATGDLNEKKEKKEKL